MIAKICFCFSLLLCAFMVQAQVQDTIHYRRSDTLIGSLKNGKTFNRLLGNVEMQQQGTTLTCDSAHWYYEANFIECFGNVHINSVNGGSLSADYIKYNGGSALAYANGAVQVVDGDNTLSGNTITYNLKSKIATYTNGATLQRGETILTSNTGTYNGKTKEALFSGDVVVTNPKYTVNSDKLRYHTEREYVTFLAQSTIITDNATIYGKNGYYDAKRQEGKFNSRSTVLSDEQEVTANTLFYNEKTGEQTARGNVNLYDAKERRRLLCEKLDYNAQTTKLYISGDVQIDEFAQARIITCEYAFYHKRNAYMKAMKKVVIYDSVQQSILQCDTVQFNFERDISLAHGKPLLRSLAGEDSLFLRAAEFFSAPALALDTIKHFYVPAHIVADSTAEKPSDVKRILIARHNVRMFTDSMQALCDSMTRSDIDSTFRLFIKPIVWANGSQATADTIYMQTQNNKAKKLLMRTNSFIISDTKATDLYDQISGKNIDGDIVDEALDELFVDGNARSLYFSKNDSGAYEGMNIAEAAQLKIKMKDKKVRRIAFYSEPKGSMTPMDKVTAATRKLEGFLWQEDRRPKNKNDVIEGK